MPPFHHESRGLLLRRRCRSGAFVFLWKRRNPDNKCYFSFCLNQLRGSSMNNNRFSLTPTKKDLLQWTMQHKHCNSGLSLKLFSEVIKKKSSAKRKMLLFIKTKCVFYFLRYILKFRLTDFFVLFLIFFLIKLKYVELLRRKHLWWILCLLYMCYMRQPGSVDSSPAKEGTFVLICLIIAKWLISKQHHVGRWKGSINWQFDWIILLWWGLMIQQSK